jgi:hypothetical protein
MSFAKTPSAMQARLTVGTIIPNWTAANGLLGDSFAVTAVSVANIRACAPAAKSIQSIPEAHFEAVYAVWGKYCAGKVSRPDIRKISRFSKYVISIFHWLEGRCGGSLP